MRNFSVSEVGQYLAVGYWQETGGWTPPNPGRSIDVNMSTLSSTNQALARQAMDAWSVLGFEFSITNSRDAYLTLRDWNFGAETSWRMSYASWSYVATSNVGPDFSNAYGPSFGGFTYQTWLHEIGHALGLGHTGNYNGDGTYGVDNHFANDSWQMSVMSYFPQDENTSIDASFAYVLTPMPGDIAGILQRYGTDINPGVGDTKYFWDTNATGIYGRIGGNIMAGRLTEPFTLTVMDWSGIDTLSFRGESQAVNLSLTPGAISSAFGVTGNVIIERNSVIENVIGSQAGDTISGQFADNLLEGRAGHDLIFGRDGTDTLIGAAGNDSLYGGAGNDILDGGDGADLLDGGVGLDMVRLGAGAVLIDLADASRNRGEVAGDRLVSIEGVLAGNGADTLLGNWQANRLAGSGGNDRIDGRIGNDHLDGGAGADTLIGGDGDDVLIGGEGDDALIGGAGGDQLMGLGGTDRVTYGDGRVRIDLRDASQNAGEAAGDRISGVEVFVTGNGADSLLGDYNDSRFLTGGGNDLVDGRYGNDWVDGGDGADTLNGSDGNDTLLGGAGEDRLLGGAGADRMIGGAGIDTAVYWGAAVVVDLRDTGRSAGDGAGDLLSEIEIVVSGNADDDLRGDWLDNQFLGQGGADLLVGRLGNDLLEGGDGNDTLIGGLGNDSLLGGTGADRIEIEAGLDLVTGGGGADDFVFKGGQCVITDFADGLDDLVIDRAAIGRPALTVEMIMDLARAGSDFTQLDFGGGNKVVINGISDPLILADDLVLI